MAQPQCYELVPCLNQSRVIESFTERDQAAESDIFRNTQDDDDDDDVSLSCEDWRFLDIMEANIHRNDDGN